MPKIKLPTKSPHIDMTPMVDLFSLLLTFFMLTSTFRPNEVVKIDIPKSVTEKLAPDKNIMTVIISKDGRVFFNIDNGADSVNHFRTDLIKSINEHYKLNLDDKDIKKFSEEGAFGLPAADIPKWLRLTDSKEAEALQKGIPIDSADNQLAMWILLARKANENVQACIKGDADAEYKLVKKVLDILQEKNVNRFSLITNLSSQGKEEAKLEEGGK